MVRLGSTSLRSRREQGLLPCPFRTLAAVSPAGLDRRLATRVGEIGLATWLKLRLRLGLERDAGRLADPQTTGDLG